jgi:hypothetical protein
MAIAVLIPFENVQRRNAMTGRCWRAIRAGEYQRLGPFNSFVTYTVGYDFAEFHWPTFLVGSAGYHNQNPVLPKGWPIDTDPPMPAVNDSMTSALEHGSGGKWAGLQFHDTRPWRERPQHRRDWCRGYVHGLGRRELTFAAGREAMDEIAALLDHWIVNADGPILSWLVVELTSSSELNRRDSPTGGPCHFRTGTAKYEGTYAGALSYIDANYADPT